ncbi:DRC1 protein, partial [Piaya cayana]|nr:DRC1 protein [Piaya cayana]
RVEKLENEAKSSAKKEEEIISKWVLAKEMRNPQELWQLLCQQQQQCRLLLETKNKLISDLQQDLKTRDEQYVQAIQKQSDDIYLLLERMEEQIKNVLKSYCHELLQIEKAFELEQQELRDNGRKKWEEAIRAHNTQELEHLHARMRKVEEFEKQLSQLQVQDEEEYSSMKRQLENNVQNLEKEIEHRKAIYRLNREKLEHNLQVLKKQDEENTIFRSQQKRNIKRLHGLLSNVRTKLANQEKQFRENQGLTADYERFTKQCEEIKSTMRHLAVSDAEKFTEIWLMNEKEAKGLMRKALDADHIIHTQQLGLPWEEPQYWFLNHAGPIRSYKAKKTVTKLIAEILTVDSGEGGKQLTPKAEDRATSLQNIPKATAKRILELMSNELDFLIERKLLKSLIILGRHKRMPKKLASIFEALKINTEDELCQLLDFFLKYKAQDVAASQTKEVNMPGLRGCNLLLLWLNRASCTWIFASGSPGGEDVTDLAEDREDDAYSVQNDDLKHPRSSQSSIPPVSIHADDVLKILNAFMQDFNKLREKDGAAKEVLQERDSSKDGEYWEALTHVIPKPTLKLWDALEVALKEY